MPTLLRKLAIRRSIAVPGLLGLVMGIMFGLGQHDQIFQPIVRTISIDVMDVLLSEQLSLKNLLHQDSVFGTPHGTRPNFFVPLAVTYRTKLPVMVSTSPERVGGSTLLSSRGAVYRTKPLFSENGFEEFFTEFTGLHFQLSHRAPPYLTHSTLYGGNSQ